MSVLGLLLAAGAGRRMGSPKALLRDKHGKPFVARGIDVLLDGGCDAVLVVTGASADIVASALRETARDDSAIDVVVADDWDLGMGASLRAGLAAAQERDAACALVNLVDLPDVGPAVVRRLLDELSPDRATLARATYDRTPGHPVLIGRDHWSGVIESASGDKGARDYLAKREPVLVECGDLATGRDTDTPVDLRR